MTKHFRVKALWLAVGVALSLLGFPPITNAETANMNP